ncbi:hypothetical protein JYU34_001987 [Plutella xylostella]|uniref:SEC7 domain-containing protein n=1 Tax=Plutella xylostella TaxID=51655 RepID=A0ABQ7R5A1_PLUXY|nr:hypothetical protein JYU34_001987 [Plutella xylostella]
MSLPGNGIFVVQGEMAMLVTAMRRSTRWGSHSFPNEEYDVLMRTFQDLKTILNQVDDLRLLDPATYLSPFLEVIRSKETTGPVTSLALSAIHKFLSYGLIDPTHPSVPATVEDIADAVTHARFVGTDHSSDGVVLMKILQVLRTLMLSPEGTMLTDESVCEIMLSCFRICFETRLTELLRRNAEQCLRDMTQLVFMRLPQFSAAAAPAPCAAMGLSLKKREKGKKKGVQNSLERKSPVMEQTSSTSVESDEVDAKSNENLLRNNNQDKNLCNEAEITIEPSRSHARASSMDLSSRAPLTHLVEKCVSGEQGADQNLDENKEKEDPNAETEKQDPEKPEQNDENTESTQTKETPEEEVKSDTEDGCKMSKSRTEDSEKLDEVYVNNRGIRFTPQDEANLQPYGLTCVRELFRFLISLCNPLDTQNTSAMVHLGLCLVGTALEVGADQLARHPALLALARDPLCRSLTSLLSTERISIFALDLQVAFLLFESLRYHLKFQLEAFLKKIVEIVSSDTTKAVYELKEIQHLALEFLAQLLRIPGICTEVFLNYDCDVYCMNMFEELTKLLSKNVVSSTAYNIHSLSLEVLMTVIEAIEVGSSQPKEDKADIERPLSPGPRFGRSGQISLELGGLEDPAQPQTHHISQYTGRAASEQHLPTLEEIEKIVHTKKWVTQGTELFNQKPEKGIEFLQQHGVLATPLDPAEVAVFLKENSDLDKKMIGDYICKRSNINSEEGGSSVLGAFASSFDFSGLRIDQALRLYLESFRLPGEAPLIFLVMERFAEHWHSTNGEPFANTDAAFRLAYATIMLNMDQHNHSAKKLNVPMNVEDFVKNLRGCNGSGDFPQPMLEAIFHSIKNEEMVMPAERVGPVRDAYLWRVLQRRGDTAAGRYLAVSPANQYHATLFAIVGPPTVTALSAAFERAPAPTQEEISSSQPTNLAIISLAGLQRVAGLAARLPSEHGLTVDTLLITLCKFTQLTGPVSSPIAIGVTLGQSTKAQMALTRACAVAAKHGDLARAAWTQLACLARQLHAASLLPQCLVTAEDYLSESGVVPLVREPRGADAGLLSSIYSYIALGETGIRAPTPHEKALIDVARECVARCNLPPLLVEETKFLHLHSLQELVRALISAGAPPDPDSLQMNPQLEDATIFFLELLGKLLIQNRDRVLYVWDEAGAHFRSCMFWASARATTDSYAISRVLTALLRTSARLMRSEHCAPKVLANLEMLFDLPYKLFYQQSDIISCGLYELVKTSAQNVHSAEEWQTVFSLLGACCGAWPNGTAGSGLSSSRSSGSSDEAARPTSASSDPDLAPAQGWCVINNPSTTDFDRIKLKPCKVSALARTSESLSLVVRDVAHVTPHNLRAAVRALATAAAAATNKKPHRRDPRPRSGSRRPALDDSSDDEGDPLDQYYMVSIQLLDLMHTLHSRTAQIFRWWKEEADQVQEDFDLWEVAWLPLLQGMAQFCTDRRKQVANTALAYLQRALLAPGMAGVGGAGWEASFRLLLFPLLQRRRRAKANTTMCKVFLHHLSALTPRPSFPALWLDIVQIQRSLVLAPNEALTEAAVESLKNMILVMDSVKVFSNADGYTDLWHMTWEKISEFLPNLKQELFPNVNDNPKPSSLPSHMQPPPPSLPTLVPVRPTNSNSTPTLLPSSPTLLPASPPTISQGLQPTFQPTLVAPVARAPAQYANVGQSPPVTSSGAVSGMVPIRNTLYSQGLTSSVLLQPLNEMISTPIGTTMTTPMPILVPTNQTQELPKTEPVKPEPANVEPYNAEPKPAEPNTKPAEHKSTILDINFDDNLILPEKEVQQSEIYAEYLNNPYNDKEDSTKEAPYNVEENRLISNIVHDQTVSNTGMLRNPLLDLDKKSYSENPSPMHTANKAQFGSSDNIKREEGMFNFTSYFGLTSMPPGAEVFDNLMTSEG